MCSNPLEISYSHIAEITLQDAPNVISQGFSTSIWCQGETLTSNIMDFRLFPSLPTSLLLFVPLIRSVLSCPLLFVVDVRSIFGVDVMNLAKQSSQKRPLTDRGGVGAMANVLHFCFLSALEESSPVQCCYTLLQKCFYPSTSHASLTLLKNRRADGAMLKYHVYFCLLG